jgi:endonuclease G
MNYKTKKLLASAIGAVVISIYSLFDSDDCPQFFVAGQIPTLTSATAKNTKKICYKDYAVLHSGVTKTPLWSAEHLTQAAIARGQRQSRKDTFHPENKISAQHRAELSDYQHSGFDRGHMTPDKDAPWATDLDSLANMVPQSGPLNRGPWAELEKNVRQLATEQGELYVITGPAFTDDSRKQRFIGRGVMVPSHVWKVVYQPKNAEVQAFLAENRDTASVENVPLAEVERLAGMKLFPGIKSAQATGKP